MHVSRPMIKQSSQFARMPPALNGRSRREHEYGSEEEEDDDGDSQCPTNSRGEAVRGSVGRWCWDWEKLVCECRCSRHCAPGTEGQWEESCCAALSECIAKAAASIASISDTYGEYEIRSSVIVEIGTRTDVVADSLSGIARTDMRTGTQTRARSLRQHGKR